jgi:hypothetical protein
LLLHSHYIPVAAKDTPKGQSRNRMSREDGGDIETNKGAPCLHREEFLPCNNFFLMPSVKKMAARSVVVPESRSVRKSRGKAFVFPALHVPTRSSPRKPRTRPQLLLYGYLSSSMSNRMPQRQRSGRGRQSDQTWDARSRT